MKGKVLFVVGLGVGYVLGTRAGRRRYEQIKSVTARVWESPAVQRQVHNVQGYAADRIGDLGTAVTESVKRAVTRSGDASGSTSSSSKSGSSSTAKSSTAKSSTAKSSSGKSASGTSARGTSSTSRSSGSGSTSRGSKARSAGTDGRSS